MLFLHLSRHQYRQSNLLHSRPVNQPLFLPIPRMFQLPNHPKKDCQLRFQPLPDQPLNHLVVLLANQRFSQQVLRGSRVPSQQCDHPVNLLLLLLVYLPVNHLPCPLHNHKLNLQVSHPCNHPCNQVFLLPLVHRRDHLTNQHNNLLVNRHLNHLDNLHLNQVCSHPDLQHLNHPLNLFAIPQQFHQCNHLLNLLCSQWESHLLLHQANLQHNLHLIHQVNQVHHQL